MGIGVAVGSGGTDVAVGTGGGVFVAVGSGGTGVAVGCRGVDVGAAVGAARGVADGVGCGRGVGVLVAAGVAPPPGVGDGVGVVCGVGVGVPAGPGVGVPTGGRTKPAGVGVGPGGIGTVCVAAGPTVITAEKVTCWPASKAGPKARLRKYLCPPCGRKRNARMSPLSRESKAWLSSSDTHALTLGSTPLSTNSASSSCGNASAHVWV